MRYCLVALSSPGKKPETVCRLVDLKDSDSLYQIYSLIPCTWTIGNVTVSVCFMNSEGFPDEVVLALSFDLAQTTAFDVGETLNRLIRHTVLSHSQKEIRRRIQNELLARSFFGKVS